MRGPASRSTASVAGMKLERRAVEPQPVVLAGHAERLAQPARPRAEQPRVVQAAPLRPSRSRPESARVPGSARPAASPPRRRRSSGTSGCRTSGRRMRDRAGRTSSSCVGVSPLYPWLAGSPTAYASTSTMRPPMPSTSNVTPTSSGATSWTDRAKKSGAELQNSFAEPVCLALASSSCPRPRAEIGRGRPSPSRPARRSARRARATGR